MNWQLWLEGLGFAALNGAVTGVVQVVSTGGKVNQGTLVTAGVGALMGIMTYLKTPAK